MQVTGQGVGELQAGESLIVDLRQAEPVTQLSHGRRPRLRPQVRAQTDAEVVHARGLIGEAAEGALSVALAR